MITHQESVAGDSESFGLLLQFASAKGLRASEALALARAAIPSIAALHEGLSRPVVLMDDPAGKTVFAMTVATESLRLLVASAFKLQVLADSLALALPLYFSEAKNPAGRETAFRLYQEVAAEIFETNLVLIDFFEQQRHSKGGGDIEALVAKLSAFKHWNRFSQERLSAIVLKAAPASRGQPLRDSPEAQAGLARLKSAGSMLAFLGELAGRSPSRPGTRVRTADGSTSRPVP